MAPPAGQARTGLLEVPDLIGTSLRGAPISLGALRGQVVVLDVMANWCQTCVELLPRWEALAHRLRGEPFAVIVVSQDEEFADIEGLVARRGITAPVLRDADERWWRAFGCSVMPTAVVIGGDGRLVLRRHGLGQGGFAEVEATIAAELARLKRP